METRLVGRMDGSYNKRCSGGAKISVPRPSARPFSNPPLPSDPFYLRESKVAPPKPLLMTIRRYFQITVITPRARVRGRRENAIPTIAVGG